MGLFDWFKMSKEREEYLSSNGEIEKKDSTDAMYDDIVGSGKGRSKDHDGDHTNWDTNYDNTN